MGKSKFLAALCAASLLVTATVATTVMAQDNNASTASEYTAKYQQEHSFRSAGIHLDGRR